MLLILFKAIFPLIGTGEYGIVYKAHLTRGGLPQLVAVKTVKGKHLFTFQFNLLAVNVPLFLDPLDVIFPCMRSNLTYKNVII